MVAIDIIPHRGNHAREFPFIGYLGVSPVVLQGFVKTSIEGDKKKLLATCILVRIRCCEYLDSTSNILWEMTNELWKPNEEQEIGDLNLPFRLEIPKSCPGSSICTYKSYRIRWHIEAGM